MARSATRAGILWTGLEKVLVYGITFVQGVILARLLGPEDFGLAAMLGIFLGVGGILAESGLGTALVVWKDSGSGENSGMRELEMRVFRWNVGVALGLYLLLAACSPLIAAWYAKPVLVPLMLVMAVGVVINAGGVVAIARLTRTMAFDRLAWINTGCAIGGSVFAIVLAWKGAGVWSIAGMGLVAAVVRVGLSWWFARRKAGPGPAVREKHPAAPWEFRGLLRYGVKLTVSGIVHVCCTESYNLVIGKMWSAGAVGLFARGQRWARLPGEIINESVGRVALPVLAGGHGRGREFLYGLLNCVLLWPGLAILWFCAEDVVRVVFGAAWLDCVPYLRILIVGQFFTPIGNISLQLLRARGHAGTILKTDAWKKPLGMLALLCGIPFGVVGLCWAKVASDVVEATVDVIYAFLACRTDVNLAYRTQANLRPYLWRFELLTHRSRISPRAYPDTWCHYLIALLECGKTRAFDRLLGRYRRKGGDLSHLAKYFRLAEAAVSRGCQDEEVLKTAAVCKDLCAEREAAPFADMVRGKTVAVVGNGPQEIGRGLGPEIDGHDVVIRINNYVLKGYEADYGTRTDVWVKNTTEEMRHEKPGKGIRAIVYNGNWDRDQLDLGYRERIATDLADADVRVDYIDTAARHELSSAIGAVPTTGGLVLAMLRDLGCKAVDAYGCSYVEGEDRGDYRRLPKDVPEEKVAEQVAWHRFDREVDYFSKLFDGRRLRA